MSLAVSTPSMPGIFQSSRTMWYGAPSFTAALTISTAVSVLEGMHILVAEDNEINAEILEELLDMVGATCDICENGQAVAEAFAASQPGQYRLLQHAHVDRLRHMGGHPGLQGIPDHATQ